MSAHPDDIASVTAANRDRLMGVAAAISTITNSERQMNDLSDLEAKARAATQGEWECRHGDEVWLAIEGDIGRHVATADREEDAAYIAAAQPSVVLQLIERIRAAEAKAGEPVAWMHPESLWVNKDHEYVAVHCLRTGKQPLPLYAAPVDAADEIERLTAERDAALAKLAQYEQAPVVGWAITDGTTTDFARYKDEANEVASSIDAVIPLIARPEVTK